MTAANPLVAVDLHEIQHKPMSSARSPRGHQPVPNLVAALTERIAELEAELAAEHQRSAGHRADYELERDRADDMVAIQSRLVTELKNLRRLLEAAPGARPVTGQTWRWWRWRASAASRNGPHFTSASN